MARQRWLPIVVAALTIAAAFYHWRSLKAEEAAQIRRMTQLATASIRADITDGMQSRLSGLLQLAMRWEMQGKPSKEQWQSDATLLLSPYLNYRAIEWADPSLHVRWVVPAAARATDQDRDLAADVRVKDLLQAVRDGRRLVIMHFTQKWSGKKTFWACVPIVSGPDFDGYILGVFREDLLERILEDHAGLGYAAVLFDGQEAIYGPGDFSSRKDTAWKESTPVQFYGNTWSLWVWPKPELVADMQALVNEDAVLAAGLVFALLLGLMTYLAQVTLSRARYIETANRKLQGEITQRRHTERTLRLSEDKFSKAFRASPDAIVISTLGEGRFIEVNDAFLRFTGYQREEVIGRTVSELHPWERPTDRAKLLSLLREHGRVQDWECNFRSKSGQTRVGLVSAEVIQVGDEPLMLTVVEDVTQQKEAEKALRVAEEKFRALLEGAPYAVVAVCQEGRIVLVNRQTEELFGYDRRELLGQLVEVLVPERFRGIHRQHRGTYVSSPKTRFLCAAPNLCGRRKDGTEFPVDISLSPVETPEGLLVMSIIRDVTERRRAAEALQRAHDELEMRVRVRTAELERANRELQMEIVERKLAEESLRHLSGQLLHLQDGERRRIARELHDSTAQTLIALTTNLAIVQESASLPDPQARKALADALAFGEQCCSEIRTISYLLHPPLLDELGLVSALQWYAEGFSERSGISLDLDMPTELGRLPEEIERTVFRLVQEALANIHRHSGSRTAKVRVVRDGTGLVLEVIDYGRGIPSRMAGRSGAGVSPLGVGILGMRERVRQLQGSLEIESSSSGTTVRAVLPIAGSESQDWRRDTEIVD
ncbi:MAG: PAS domain S-box protein [Acidobacteria bacterium]|nr:PAS domain S-box protein [Acidobacteriota bacterium]